MYGPMFKFGRHTKFGGDMEHDLPVRRIGEPYQDGRLQVAPSDQTTIRRANLALVMRYINDHGPCPR